MLRHIFRAMLGVVVTLATAHSIAAPVAVPPELEAWRGWALDGLEYRRCPLIATSQADSAAAFRCVWPERLSLSLDARGGRFTQQWQLYAQSWVRLPGNSEHWPQDVRVNGAPGAVVMRDGHPALQLLQGAYAVSGTFEWAARPEQIEIDPRTALVDLSIDGRNVAQPERPGGAVWLGKRRSAEQAERMEVQVYRLVADEVPVRLVTRIRLQVAGDAREELLARALPPGFVPTALQGALPARLEPDGHLRVQVRPGTWELTLSARGAGAAAQIARPAGDGEWAREEIWSFQSNDRLRIAAVEGVEGIDPAQANVPQEWRTFPAFRMARDSKLSITERSRGLQNADDNRLTLARSLWLDFDHGGLTAVDHISGRMLRDWRLETASPFAVQSASAGAESVLITRNPDGKGVGLEVRSPMLNLQATTRSSRSGGTLPATGWQARFDSVSGQLNLPPGHRLIAVAGADSAPTAWFERWGLWGIFGVLIVAVFAGWLGGVPLGAVAFAALLLTYQEEPSYIWLWSNLLAAMALARAAPEGRLLRFARSYRLASFVVLGIALLPLVWGQVRLALYPQLEGRLAIPMGMAVEADAVAPAAAPPVVADVAEAVPAPMAEVVVEEKSREARRTDSYKNAANQPISVSGGLNYRQVVQRYAPGTLLQTGPGIPRWRYGSHPYSWSGPVEAEQTVRFIYIGPVLLGLWRIVSVMLLAALFAALLRASGLANWRWPPGWGDRFGRSSVAAASVCLGLLVFASPASHAQPALDSELLQELRQRLTRPPECVPTCADISYARVNVRADSLDVTLQVSALATVAVAVPNAADRWQLESVAVDGRASLAVAREGDDSLWIPLTAGAHTVRLAGRLASAESIQLAFPTPPRHVSVSNEGWDVSGVSEGRLLAGSIELTRRRGSADRGAALDAASEFPAFVRVTRNVDLSLDWTVSTSVERIAPERAAIGVEVPLIAGESVLSESVEVREAKGGRVALVGLERGQDFAQWSAGLPRGEQLELRLPADAPRAEVWRFSVSPQWNVTFTGLPAVLPEDQSAATWVYEFHPRPGESVQMRIQRPERAEGATLAVDSVQQNLQVGKRSSTTSLDIGYRSTQGGRHVIKLPKQARVLGVQLDGQSAQVRPVGDELSLELRPGTHRIGLQWITPAGASLRTQPLAVDLRTPASNIDTSLSLPPDRWPLLAYGPGVGPAIVYWGELVIFIGMAWLLGRSSRSPLRTHEWLLLGLGLSTRSWVVLVVVAIWLFALRWREGWNGPVSRWRFNFVQLLLATLTVIAVGCLVFAGIRGSLLAAPDMGLQGPGSYGNQLSWFDDRTAGLLPQPTVISAPMWMYRVLMFAWALWLVFALLRWLRWAWQAWKSNGYWRGPLPKAPAA